MLDYRLDDETGFAAECEEGRGFGFDGKSLIHPNQIEGAKDRVLALNIETETGSGIRDVICKWRTETSEKGMREWVLRRSDTGEAVGVQPLRADEMQEEMFS